MTKLSRLIHIYISLFFLPMALLFAISGALFIFGFDSEIGAKYQTYTLEKEIAKGQEANAMLEYLKQNNITLPKINPLIIKMIMSLLRLALCIIVLLLKKFRQMSMR